MPSPHPQLELLSQILAATAADDGRGLLEDGDLEGIADDMDDLERRLIIGSAATAGVSKGRIGVGSSTSSSSSSSSSYGGARRVTGSSLSGISGGSGLRYGEMPTARGRRSVKSKEEREAAKAKAKGRHALFKMHARMKGKR